ncbi:hypothetical protein GCM10028796_05230 [Ramlibacter monticola]
MPPLRKHLRHVAALVLLVWLFAAGAAIAKVCVAHVHMEDPEGCCATMQVASARVDVMAEAVAPAQPAQPCLADVRPAQTIAAPARQHAQHPIPPSWNDSGQQIHLVLQRLAL